MTDNNSLSQHVSRFTQYLSSEDQTRIQQAFVLAERAHTGQLRHSGEPYITHPVAVAAILAEWRLDADGLAAALLHDVIEDTKISRDDIKLHMGSTVLYLVDAVSKLDHIEFASKEDAQAESFRRMLLAMTQDIRVMLIKLADRLHNMRTLGPLREQKRRRIAQETLDIYVPIAHRLGLNRVYTELHDLAFQAMHPQRYLVLQKALKAVAGGQRANRIETLLSDLEAYLRANGVEATVTGRPKSLYSIYQKMREKRMRFEQVNDLFGCRVIVERPIECYMAMGLIHQRYKPIPGKIKDYIAIPKPNGYQSLHTTVFGPFSAPLEIQIRTEAMHHIAETGLAAHWRYKQGSGNSLAAAQQEARQWMRQLLDIQSKTDSSKEFLSNVKKDLFPSEVYVFTPRGDIIALPRGSSALDFAYAVHTEIGHHCSRVKINQQPASLKTPLKNGDRVEIITADNCVPQPNWLNWVITGRARSSIRHYLNRHPDTSERSSRLRALLGNSTILVLTKEILGQIRWARCCSPIHGDHVTGGLSERASEALVIHRSTCTQLRLRIKESSLQAVPLQWSKEESLAEGFICRFEVWAENQLGMLAKLAQAIADANINIVDISLHGIETQLQAHLHITVRVHSRSHLAQLFRVLRKLKGLHHLYRSHG